MKKNLDFTLYVLCALLFLFSGHAVYAQSGVGHTVAGVVVSEEDGEPLPGVAITVVGQSRQTTSDADGKFTLTLPKVPAEVQFSFVGMKKKIITCTARDNHITVQLASSTQLAEVVIEAGYGLAQKRSDMVGSAFQVQSKDLQTLSPARVDKMLDGLVPGLTVAPNSSSPGSPRTRFNIRVRGDASLSASNEPLWVIDGVPLYQGSHTNMMPGTSYTVSPLSYLNPDDIESITVLKDASSTSIYGANGANGVIIVKTKAGRKSGDKIQVNAYLRYGVSTIDQSTRIKVMNAAQYMAYAKAAWANGGKDMNAFPFQDNDLNTYSTADFDWGNLYFGRGSTTNTGLSIVSGGDKYSNRLSISYFNEMGTVLTNNQQRFSARFNSNYRLAQRLNFGATLSASYNDNNLFALGHEYYETPPIYTPYLNDGYSLRLYNRMVGSVTYDADGKPLPVWEDKKFFGNSLPDRLNNRNRQKTSRVSAVSSIKLTLIDGLELTEQFGVDLTSTHEAIYKARTTLDGLVNNEPKGYSERGSANYLNWNNIFRLNYHKKLAGFTIGALAGVELQHNQYATLGASGSGFLNDRIQEISYAEAATRQGRSSFTQKRSLSYLGQAELSYKSRYFFTANARADGNSNFGKYARWARFGSLGLSWNMHNEDFFGNNTVDFLKLKTSLGTNGNSRIDASVNTGTYNYSDSYAYNGTAGAVMSSIPNPGLSWETTTMFNFGARATFWGRIELDVEYYNNYTKDLLSKIYTSRTISDDRLYANVGEMRNQGIELTINSKNIASDDFGWFTDFIVAHNTNKITKLYNGMMTSFGTTVWAENYPKGAYYLIRWAGVDPATGAPMWFDKNNNITFTYSPDNRVLLKDKRPEPIAFGSLTNTFNYRNLSLKFMFKYSFGGYDLSDLYNRAIDDGLNATSRNSPVEYVSYWTTPGQTAINPRISVVSSQSSMTSTRFLLSTTHVNFQHITLSYNVPKKFCKRIQLDDCSLSFIADNLYLWTPDQKKNRNSYKTVMNPYPTERQFSFSINLGL